MRMWLGLVGAVVVSAGCTLGGGSLLPEGFPVCQTGSAAEACPPFSHGAEKLDGPTWWTDVKPIVDAKCATCHVEDGIGPLPFASYADVASVGEFVKDSVSSGWMPPWQPDNCCEDYQGDRSLTEDQILTLTEWVDQGMLEGDPAQEGPPLPQPSGLDRIDAVVKMPVGFSPEPQIGADEVRCFVLEGWQEQTADVFMTGLDVRPGNRTTVHHVILYMVDHADLDELARLDAGDARPGWDCYGFAGLGVTPAGIAGGWTPGTTAQTLPAGLGRKIPAGAVFVLNVHYDTSNWDGLPDQTEVLFQTEPEVERETRGMAVANPLWLVGDGMRIEKNDPDAMHYFSYDPTGTLIDGAFDIHGVNLHMHELGSRGTIAILRKNGDVDCLLHVPDWDFNWMGDYLLEKPVRFNPGDKLYVECHWDNTTANQKVVAGVPQEPRTLRWGTDEEMCAGLLLVAEP